ncbi:MAG: hypothetical protein A2082_04665 [Chloroflexi bacterium GWC2_70_10]|nr:MAG: hypothetical protein A2082_04665 [Chloroflexi bacterium GWC2_70_10]
MPARRVLARSTSQPRRPSIATSTTTTLGRWKWMASMAALAVRAVATWSSSDLMASRTAARMSASSSAMTIGGPAGRAVIVSDQCPGHPRPA